MVKVLVVEDEASIREMIALNLRLAAVFWLVSPVYILSWPVMDEKRRYMVCWTPL